MGFMVSIKSTFFVVHVIIDSLYLKYPYKTKEYYKLNQYLKHLKGWKNGYIKRLNTFKRSKLYPFEFYSTIDKIINNYGIQDFDVNKLLRSYFYSDYKDTKYAVFEALINLCDYERVEIVEQIEPIITNMSKWIMDFPYDRTYRPIYNLAERPLKTFAERVRPPRLSYEEFETIIKDWTDDEIIEAIGRYKQMTPKDYTKNPNRMLYSFMEIGKRDI